MTDSNAQINPHAMRAFRAQRGYSQQRLAVMAEISPAYVSSLESGARENVSVEVLHRLLDALHLKDERAITRWWTVVERAAAEAELAGVAS